MQDRKDTGGKEYDELIREALSQVLLYSDEWTNFNLSDPGVTILENLTAFNALQGSSLNAVTDKAREGLCALAGFTRQEGRPSRAWLMSQPSGRTVRLLKNQKLLAGEFCYETQRELEAGSVRLVRIIREAGGMRGELKQLMDPLSREPAYPFGEEPQPGSSLYFVFTGLPKPGDKLWMYVQAVERVKRNRFVPGEENLFADLAWSLYTQEGYQEIAGRDESGAFVQDGMITLRMPRKKGCADPAVSESGYVIKCTLKRSEYDVAPRLAAVYGGLIPVVQKDTLALPLLLGEREGGMLRCAMLEGNYLSVYGLEDDGRYYEYEEDIGSEAGAGRRYRKVKTEDGVCRFWLEGGQYTAGREEDKPCAIIVLRSYDTMQHYRLGTAYGYQGQEMKLGPFRKPEEDYIPGEGFLPGEGSLPREGFLPGEREYSHIVLQDCLVGACSTDKRGIRSFRFFRPGDTGRGALRYTLLQEECAIRIDDAGEYEESELLLCGLSVSYGKEGNIRAGNEFFAAGKRGAAAFFNPMAAFGGRDRESIEEMTERLLEDIHAPSVLVSGADYEALVRNMPGLAIHKVKAFAVPGRNEVKIAVKPCADGPGAGEKPILSAIYRAVLAEEIEKRRLLTVHVELLSPEYVPVRVRGTIFVTPFQEDYRERVEDRLRKMLDYVASDRDFGGTISFHEVLKELEGLECVEEVGHLSLIPGPSHHVVLEGADVRMEGGALCYPGEFSLEFRRKYNRSQRKGDAC